MTFKLQLATFLAVSCLLFAPIAKGGLVDCVDVATIGPGSIPNIAAIAYCGNVTPGPGPSTISVSTPSGVSASSVLGLLEGGFWLGPLLPDGGSLESMESASGALLLLSPEFLATGGTISFDYELVFDGPGYGELGFAACPTFIGDGGGFDGLDGGPDGLRDGFDCLSPAFWGKFPIVGGTAPASGTFSELVSPAPFPEWIGGIYLVSFSETRSDPSVTISNLRVEPVPEPASLLLVLGGLGLLAWRQRKQVRQR